MAKQSSVLFLITLASAWVVLVLLCFPAGTESRELANEENQVEPDQFPNVNEPVTPSNNLDVAPPPPAAIPISDQVREGGGLIASPEANNSVNEGTTTYTWCIVKPSTDEWRLQNNIIYSCDHFNCSIIQPGGTCFYPNNSVSHASVVMNLYYKAFGKDNHNCDFIGSGLIISTDPSVGECIYEV